MAIAAEWESQETHIMPHLMPLNRLAMTALDVVPKTRESIIDGVMPYLETDTSGSGKTQNATRCRTSSMRCRKRLTHQSSIGWKIASAAVQRPRLV